jgi:superfamily I DNA and RNA helicase
MLKDAKQEFIVASWLSMELVLSKCYFNSADQKFVNKGVTVGLYNPLVRLSDRQG